MQLTEEQLQIRELASDFARGEVRPHLEGWDRDAAMGGELLGQLAELGFFGMALPEEDGGMGFELPTFLVALESLGWGDASVALTVAHAAVAAELLRRHGGSGAAERWLAPIAAGEALACVALAGADEIAPEAGVAAEPDGDGWKLSGRAEWVSQGANAAVALILAATGEDAWSLFAVPADTDGFRPGERYTTMGLRPLEIVPIDMDGVRLGSDALLGEADRGKQYVEEVLVTARLAVAAISVGIAQAAVEHAQAYAAERQQFGRAIREFEAIRLKLGEMATRTAAARALTLASATAPDRRTAAEAKLFAAGTAMYVTTEAVQIFGGYGYMRDYPVEKLMRDAKAMELLEGTSDGLRLLVTAEMYAAAE